MFENMFNRLVFDHTMLRLQVERENAKALGIDHCVQCGFCCFVRPCSIAPDEIEGIADCLGFTPRELFEKRLVVDFLHEGYVVLPVRVEQWHWAGGFLPSSATWDCETPCIFLENNRCQIHEIKPRCARDSECWSEKQPDISASHWSAEQLESILGYTR